MPRRRMMDFGRMGDMRNPYGSRGGYVVSSRRGRRDRAMSDERRGDMNYGMGYSDYASRGNSRSRGSSNRMDRNMGYEMARGDRGMDYDMAYGNDSRGSYDGGTRYPFNVMGEFGRYDGNYDMNYDRHYHDPYMWGYDMGRDMRYDRAYDYAGDYGEKLTKEELEHWDKKLLKQIPERDKNFFTKENIVSRAKAMGVQMDGFSEDELYTTVLAMYTDYCESIGQNYDMYIKLGRDFLMDDDASVKGGEKLAVYYDNIVEEDD